MLILTRRIGETLKIGDEIEVTDLGINGQQIRLGIEAPKEMPVHREEVWERIRLQEAGQRKGAPPTAWRGFFFAGNEPRAQWYPGALLQPRDACQIHTNCNALAPTARSAGLVNR